jgi:hypothetical protein
MKITYLLMLLFGIDNPKNFTNLMLEQVTAEYVAQLYREGILGAQLSFCVIETTVMERRSPA